MWGLVALIVVGVHLHRLPEARGYAVHPENETAGA